MTSLRVRIIVGWIALCLVGGLMALPNLIALPALGGVVVRLTKGFLAGEQYAAPGQGVNRG